MKKECIHPEGLIKRPYYCEVVKVGNTIHIAGAVPRDKDGKPVAAGDFRGQADKVFENLQLALKAAGATLDDVVSTTAYLINIDDIPLLAEAYIKYFGTKNQPTATAIAISRLWLPEFLLEIQAIAVVE